MATPLFMYVLFKSLYLGQKIVDGFSFGCFNIVSDITQGQLNEIVTYVGANLKTAGELVYFTDDYRNLAVTGQFQLQGIDVYAKGQAGTVVEQSKSIVAYSGTRTLGGTDAMPPQTTYSVYFPCLTYGQKGCKWGLPGVYEVDNNGGSVSDAGGAIATVNALVNSYEVPFEVPVTGLDPLIFQPAKIARIKVERLGKPDYYRMPYESGDEPSAYQVGSGALNSVLGTNNHRKLGRGQ